MPLQITFCRPLRLNTDNKKPKNIVIPKEKKDSNDDSESEDK